MPGSGAGKREPAVDTGTRSRHIPIRRPGDGGKPAAQEAAEMGEMGARPAKLATVAHARTHIDVVAVREKYPKTAPKTSPQNQPPRPYLQRRGLGGRVERRDLHACMPHENRPSHRLKGTSRVCNHDAKWTPQRATWGETKVRKFAVTQRPNKEKRHAQKCPNKAQNNTKTRILS